MIIDSHCHLYDEAFEHDFDEVYKRALDRGVGKFLMVGCKKDSNLKVINLQNKYKESFATIGVHPSYVDEVDLDYFNELEELIKTNKIYAIGECGLDYYWTKDNIAVQKTFFLRQIDLAIKYDLPLVIHCRDAVADMFDILNEYKGKIRFVLHGYSGSLEMAKRFITIGGKIGIGGVVTFKNAINVKQTVEGIDLKHILLETDCPYLTPAPNRGKRNEPSYLEHIALAVAVLKNVTYDEVVNQTTKNSEELFKI
ncbi:MAG: TatD family hydrolase [bacterium]